jgi:hypothetical protein
MYVHKNTFLSYLTHFSRIRNIPDKIFSEIRNTIIHSTHFLRNLRHTVEDFCTTIEVPYDDMALAHCMLDNQGYKDNI